jgi:hypothetical protein
MRSSPTIRPRLYGGSTGFARPTYTSGSPDTHRSRISGRRAPRRAPISRSEDDRNDSGHEPGENADRPCRAHRRLGSPRGTRGCRARGRHDGAGGTAPARRPRRQGPRRFRAAAGAAPRPRCQWPGRVSAGGDDLAHPARPRACAQSASTSSRSVRRPTASTSPFRNGASVSKALATRSTAANSLDDVITRGWPTWPRRRGGSSR